MYDGDQLASHFELEVWKRYVESPRPPPLVGRLRNCKPEEEDLIKDMEIADVIRCRRSALLYNVHPIPVFCPLDASRSEMVVHDLSLETSITSRRQPAGGPRARWATSGRAGSIVSRQSGSCTQAS